MPDNLIPRLTVTKNRAEPETQVAFEIEDAIGGAPLEYRMLASVPVNASLRYMSIARDRGINHANDFLLRTVLLPDAYEAMLSHQDLTVEQANQIVDRCGDVMFGQEVTRPN